MDTGDVRDVEFVVAGARKLQQFDHLISPELRDRLADLGLLGHSEVLEQMQHADILVVSSRMESLPNILPEAFYAGLPVICTRAGGVPELVHDGHGGMLCAVEDHHCLAAKIRELLPDFERRIAMGNVNRKVVETLLTNRRKSLELLRVYHGQQVQEPLPLETITPETET
jgi:glycosyltransferase involved in cell wall biosynthesis